MENNNVNNDEYVYKKNIKNFELFLNSEAYKKLKECYIEKVKKIINTGYIDKNGDKTYLVSNNLNGNINGIKFINNAPRKNSKIDEIYVDPDSADSKLYTEIAKRYELPYECDNCRFKDKNLNIQLSLDCVIGWKAIIDVCVRENIEIERFKDAYEIIRNPKNDGHLIWPVFKAVTINTQRYRIFNDRVDYTLFDIKNYYKEKKELKDKVNEETSQTKLKHVYYKNFTAKWLDNFGNFENFIDEMKLEKWCKVNDDKSYDVLDLSENIIGVDEENRAELKNYGGQDNYKITKTYIDNIIYIISNSEKDKKFRL